MQKIIFTLWALGWWLACSPFVSAQTNSEQDGKTIARTARSPIKTWAILGDSAVTASGVTDALFAVLSATDMVLVEREQLRRIVDEQMFRTLLSGLTAESKRLGQILKADALIIVTQATRPQAIGAARNTDTKIIRLIVCDCRQGLRLGELRSDLMPVDQQAAAFAEYIVDRRQQFADGVHNIVGLAPLACRNIEHDYDHLQQRYYDMLAGSLMTIPGLALLELEEARTLSRELGAGEQAADRLVPMMVECEYRVQKREENPQVQFKAVLSKYANTIQSPVLSLEDSGAWLVEVLARNIIANTGSQPLQLADQQVLLARRADYLMRLGDLAGAVQCREAYLLAEPNDAKQRVRTIDNILAIGAQPNANAEEMRIGVREYTTRLVSMASTQSAILLDHLVVLIENQLIDQATAIDLMERMYKDARFLTGSRAHLVQVLKKDEHIRACLDTLLSANRRFVQRTAAKVLELPDPPSLSPENKARQLANWHKCVTALIADDVAVNAGAMESFRYMEQVVLDKIPETLPTSWELLNTLTTYQRSFQALRLRNKDFTFETVNIQVDEEAMKSWLGRLSASQHAHLRWYGRTVRLLNELPKRDVLLPENLQTELNSIIDEIERRPLSYVRSNNGLLLDAVLDRLDRERRARVPSPSPSLVVPNRLPPFPANEVVAGPIQVERLTVQFPDTVGAIQDYIKTENGVDIIACDKEVGVLRDSQTYVTIHKKSSTSSSMAWDGQHLWIGEPEQGITQYDLGGGLSGKITVKEGLPKHDADIRLLALKPDQLLVYGAIKPDGRCWLALVTVVESVPQIKIVHEARQPYRPLANPKDANVPLQNNDTSMSFRLDWWCAHQTSQRKNCFIGRHVQPLAIDLQAGTVTSISLEPYPATSFGTMLSRGDYLFKSYGTGVAQYELPSDSLQLKLKRVVVTGLPSGTLPIWVDDHSCLLEHEGWIYKAGKVWYRFRENGESVQRLTSPVSPNFWEYQLATSSNHFGIVGWSPQLSSPQLFKISPPN